MSHNSDTMTNKYILRATGTAPTTVPELVSYIAERKSRKDEIWRKRNDKLVSMSEQMEALISIYHENYGKTPKSARQAALFYKSSLAHQAFNTLMGTKLDPDFIDFRPLGAEFDRELMQITKELSQAHRVWRYKGGYQKAKLESKPDFIWGNSFIEMSTHYEEDRPMHSEYTHAPWKEIRNYYGDTDIMRVIDMSIETYVKNYGEEELNEVTLGGILDIHSFSRADFDRDEYDSQKDIIQVVRYYDPSRKIFAEIHGGNGYVHKHLEGKEYPFIWKNDKGFAPFKESRFFEEVNGDFFGWGVFDYIINLANLETTITNATAMEAIWDAAAPSFIFSNDPDDMDQKINKHLRNINNGINKPIVQKDSGIGTKGQVQTLKKGVDNGNMKVWDDTTVSRATRFSNIDFQALSEYAPTAEQQKLKKIESDKLNTRVLMANEEREKEFAIKEMAFIQNGKTAFHSHEIAIIDDISEEFKAKDGYMPPIFKKISDILKTAKEVELQIVPRMEGVLDDMDFLEIDTMQQDLALLQPGMAASDIAMEKYFAKKNPSWGLVRTDFSTPTAPEQKAEAGQPGMGGQPAQPGPTDPMSAALGGM